MHHEHHHHRHEHEAAPARGVAGGRLLKALAILGTFTLVEAVGGYLANSVALLAEAAHMLTDCASILLAVFAIRVGRRPADLRRTYGHRRYQPLAAFVNAQVLVLLTAAVAWQAITRLRHPPPVDGSLMLWIALLGGVANLGAYLVLSGAASLNERGARAHVLSDLLGSIAACVAAVLIQSAHWLRADPLLSLFVAALVLRAAWSLLRESADVLLESAPSRFDVNQIHAVLLGQVPGLTGVHHVHVWSMTGERPSVTLHANLAPGTEHPPALAAIHARLLSELHVEHCTVQIEEGVGCVTPECTDHGAR
ncbi:MAG: cation transporter [Gammaproteobacteria bacterium]|nr:cation transporter [Gammaproteobacteria bacterium]MBV9697917.1 cation transporter [Gammaproteobacteria bacterium]